jgi:hypothetical protein
VTGSFALGFFLTLATERAQFGPHLRLAIAVGFLGAYTTFSTFEYETLRLSEERGFALALLNVILSVVVGFAAVWGGMALARRWAGARVAAVAGHERSGGRADPEDPARSPGAERGIRDSTLEPAPRAEGGRDT